MRDVNFRSFALLLIALLSLICMICSVNISQEDQSILLLTSSLLQMISSFDRMFIFTSFLRIIPVFLSLSFQFKNFLLLLIFSTSSSSFNVLLSMLIFLYLPVVSFFYLKRECFASSKKILLFSLKSIFLLLLSSKSVLLCLYLMMDFLGSNSGCLQDQFLRRAAAEGQRVDNLTSFFYILAVLARSKQQFEGLSLGSPIEPLSYLDRFLEGAFVVARVFLLVALSGQMNYMFWCGLCRISLSLRLAHSSIYWVRN